MNRALVVGCMIMLAGCGPKKMALSAEATSLQGRTLVVHTWDPVPFADKSFAKVMKDELDPKEIFGRSEPVESKVARFQLEDPAIPVADHLARVLADRYHMDVKISNRHGTFSGRRENVTTKYPDFDFVLEVKTNYWAVTHNLPSLTKLMVQCFVQVRFIERGSGKVFASGLFDAKHEGFGRSPSAKELWDEEAALLKKMLAECSREIGAEAQQELFGQASKYRPMSSL
ncbi:hypothetical protein SCOR_34700 [Sulfidibacter corallicola]|uniref:Lipoprotein n=1 Tax=Sulfidibacter corallicola TaxID=2818388 RepID=A0A8A4TRZ4_SULCO|nr:hypothetical protein [Sulfidibacter corallicola]QTD49315.1 hypothetical protein J3U87_27330 [Sulfidibacter corallicola]